MRYNAVWSVESQPAVVLVATYLFFDLEDGGDMFHRNVG
jgi:hypothetical protein